MKKEPFIFILLLVLIGICLYQESRNFFSVEEEAIRKIDSVAIRQISISIPGKIIFTQSRKNEIVIEGPKTLIDDIQWEIVNGKLHLTSARFYYAENWKRLFFNQAYALNIYVAVQDPDDWKVTGTGSLLGKIQRSSHQLSINSFGLGEIFVYSQERKSSSLLPTSLLSATSFW